MIKNTGVSGAWLVPAPEQDENSVPAGTQNAEASIRAENDRLAHEFVALKKRGGIVDRIHLRDIRTDKLIRDRGAVRDEDIDELKTSIQALGLSNPIQVEERKDGLFELVQGWRRLTAFRELHALTKKDAFALIPATILARGERLDLLYQRMVDENAMRRDISFSEMAQLALSYAGDGRTGIANARDAVDILFASAGRQKRAYIKSFTVLLLHLDGVLAHPQAVPRALGLELVRRMDEDRDLPARLRRALAGPAGRSAEQELRILRLHATARPKRQTPKPRKSRGAKTTITVARPGGDVARCTASDGRLELSLEHDFGAHDAGRLQEAVEKLLDHLEQK